MIKFISKTVVLGSFFVSVSADAAWLTSTGKVEHLLLYQAHTVLVKLKDNNGSPVTACSNKEYFAIPASYTEESRNRMYSTLLAAKMADKQVSISYNDVDNCEPWGATTNVYRKITRITF